MYIDKCIIKIKSGDGGNGAVAFLRLKGIPYGGPDGGNGGCGGSLYFEADDSKNTLAEFYYKKSYVAQAGENGRDKNCYGKNGEDIIIKVPTGTIIRDYESNAIIADMFHNGQKVLVLSGGRGGRGNSAFANANRKAPGFSQLGEKTETKKVVLELKTIADVGFVGFPNAGKSTLLSKISGARPKIANYPFTTLTPNLGVVSHRDYSFVAADIPGLIEGASEGAGLGLEFLKHIERTRLIVHVVDISDTYENTPYERYVIINNELKKYSPTLAKLPQIVAINKCDSIDAEENLKEFVSKIPKKHKVLKISAINGEGLPKLLDEVSERLKKLPKLAPIEFDAFVYEKPNPNEFFINLISDGVYEISGGFIKELTRNVVVKDRDSFRYFQTKLKDQGVIKALKKAGIQNGDTVIVGEAEFEFEE